MFHRLIISIFLVLLAAGLYLRQTAHSQTTAPMPLPEAHLIANEANVDYPAAVNFQLELDPSIRIVDAVLTYDVEQTSCLDVSATVPVAVDGPLIEWEWAMVRSGNPPPGVDLWWEWQLTDEEGQIYQTPRHSLTFLDERFSWKSVSQDNITLYWYAGEDVGPLLLESAVAGLALLENDLGIELDEEVTFYIYGSSSDMREAVLYIQDWAGGVAFSEYNTILMGVPPNLAEGWGRKTIRHELAHLVVGKFGQSCVGGQRPTWLEEGLAMYAEGEPSDEVTSDLEQGTADNSFAPFRSLNGPFPAHGEDAGNAYSQSFSMIQFLREEYGQQPLQDLILLLAQGEEYDEALQEIYGTNIDGLEQQWRSWLDLPQRQIPPTPTAIVAANVPTVVPLAGPSDVPTPVPGESMPSSTPTATPSPTSGICSLGLVPLFLLGTLYWRKRR
ncbi:MAG: peptidase MA family metallohydrolase [Anaerolineales bacterium]|nr:peptidase MA family metallohydrolase [Anaerolineales bacterium]